jgi:tetratricopeptide (TPR) repeat protein
MSQQYRLGVQHLLRKEYDRAASAFGNIVRESPQDGQAWSNYGLALTHLGKAAEAELALSRAVALQPRNGEAWFHLGVARALREEWGDAASAYRRAVALEPDDMVAWHRLGVALAESGEEPAASAAFERALVLSREVPTSGAPPRAASRPDDHSQEGGEREGAREAKSWLDLALSLLALGDEDEAIAAYERAFTLDPERAARSLFRPMLRLLTAVGEEDPAAAAAASPVVAPEGPPRPEAVRPPPRPEVG